METNVVSRGFFSDENGKVERLDAEFAQHSLLSEEQRLTEKFKGGILSSLTTEYDGPGLSESFEDAETSVRYIAIDAIDTDDGFAYSEELKYGDRPSRAKYVVKEGDLLVSNVRPNRGAVSLVSDRNAGCLASSGFTLLRKTQAESGLRQEYIFAFLKTHFAKTQLIRRNRGSMYPAVLQRDVKDVYVPFPSDAIQDKVVKQIETATSLHNDFDKFRLHQEKLLAKFLGDVATPPPSPLSGPYKGISSSIK